MDKLVRPYKIDLFEMIFLINFGYVPVIGLRLSLIKKIYSVIR